MKVAIVGAGISGLGAAYELAKAGVHVVLYEKESYIGGHAKTVHFDGVDLDLGFMVFNRVINYTPFYNLCSPFFYLLCPFHYRFYRVFIFN